MRSLCVSRTKYRTIRKYPYKWWLLGFKRPTKAIEQLLHTSIENNCTNHVQKNYVLRFCRELEQVIKGEVAIETTYNGIYDELQEGFDTPFPQENIYFSFEKCCPKYCLQFSA